ncbi:MAG: carbonic anhydrase family protein [Desulfobulbaceae bacterium]|nr:carbonic anhydrase family protein [Desulfobulbaceae bacterium]
MMKKIQFNSYGNVLNRASFYFLIFGCLMAFTQAQGFASQLVDGGASPAPEFAYSGDHGPGFWHEINEACAGEPDDSLFRQSPINIKHVVPNRHLKPLILDLLDEEIHLKNNGHTIEQEYDIGSTLTWEGVTYELLQFHFHTFSEHVVRQKRSAMEMHAVFRNGDGELAVIGKLFEIAHKKNAFLEDFIEASLPEKKGDVTADVHLINLGDGLESTKSYYTYKGSLTTPPCSPIVTWIVLQKTGKISKEQFHAFRDIMGNNFRPLQPLKMRVVESTVKGRKLR